MIHVPCVQYAPYFSTSHGGVGLTFFTLFLEFLQLLPCQFIDFFLIFRLWPLSLSLTQFELLWPSVRLNYTVGYMYIFFMARDLNEIKLVVAFRAWLVGVPSCIFNFMRNGCPFGRSRMLMAPISFFIKVWSYFLWAKLALNWWRQIELAGLKLLWICWRFCISLMEKVLDATINK